jgi:predicted transcriptional regulator
MKSVLISIQPKYCELIASGKKTVEVRKTKPKLEVPFKVYIYCTKDNTFAEKTLRGFDDNGKALYYKANKGKVIGEFVCDRVIGTCPWRLKGETGWCAKRTEEEAHLPDMACLTLEEIEQYAGHEGRGIYGWHISDLVIYDKPRELSEFYTEGDCDCMNCKKCYWFDRGNGYNVENDCNLAYKGVELHKSLKPIIRPFQSWGYVYEIDT